MSFNDSDASAYRQQAVRPPRPQSATSRPMSAPRSTRSGLDSCPQTQDFDLSFSSSQGMQIRPGIKQGSDSLLQNISERRSRVQSASRNPTGRREGLAEQSSMAPSVQVTGLGRGKGERDGGQWRRGRRVREEREEGEGGARFVKLRREQSESSQLNSKAYEKLRSCVALGILPADAKLRLEVEHCTARRPSATLRGSSEAYVKKFSTFKFRVKDKMSAWNVEVESTSRKPKIGSFEVTADLMPPVPRHSLRPLDRSTCNGSVTGFLTRS
uniref:Uncharacterized protein n=1 Tax=Guillardia theta TaxID=55529 RepID=A0A6U5XZ65_GUITH|mmetsp:Transcript_19299/g.63870  ORF Transcript_19299/g.63870 Transcript_19299/m.63870 type:complete len:270 (+) Transcript_19299:192-1001(+)